MQLSGQIFTGVLDTDSDPRVISAEDYTYAINILNGYGETPGSLIFAKGTVSYNLQLPGGDNKCIGTCEDKQNAALFAFVYNSNGDHGIYKYSLITNSHIVIAQGAFLAFQEEWRINHAKVVNGSLLYWTDAVTDETTVSGNPQRKINAIKADLTKEEYTYELYADLEINLPFANGNTYYFSIIVGNDPNNEVEVNEYTADGTYEADPAGGLEWLLTNLRNDYEPVGLSFESCDGCKIKITIPSETGRFFFEPSATDTLMVGTNLYPIDLEDHHIDLLKVPPTCAPTATYFYDAEVSTNNVTRLCAQFRVRYIYDDYERSAWGPVSNIALNTGVDGEVISLLNAIKVEFTDEKFTDPSWMTMIRQVELAFRDGNASDWRLVGRFDTCEIGITTQEIYFYNDKQYSVLASDDLSTPATLQVLKPFDFLPIRSLCLEATANAEGNTLLFLGANQENYDNPDCIDLAVEPVEFEEDCLIDIIGTVEIVNDANFPSADPDFSAYPLGGIVVYLAGTPYYGISNNPADGTGDGGFIIKGVPRGRYIMRAASYKCSFTNDLSPRYNLANGLEWQRTSAPVIDMAGAVANGLCQYEREINLGSFTDPVFDLDTETDYGVIEIANAHETEKLLYTGETTDHDPAIVFLEVYLLDNAEEYDTQDKRIGAISVERQDLTFTIPGESDVDLASEKTDHNGYCWYRAFEDEDETNNTPFAFKVNGVLVDTTPVDNPLWPGDYLQMYDDSLEFATNPNTIYYTSAYQTENRFIFNDGNFSIIGPIQITCQAVADDATTGVDGVIFTYTRTGRTAIAGFDGSAQIAIYVPPLEVPFVVRTRDNDNIIALYLPDFCHDGYPDPDYENVIVTENDTSPVTGPTFQFLLDDMDFATGRFLKGGGEYSFGIVYEDRGNRTPGAIFGSKLKIPVHIDGLTKWQMQWSINSLPPDWATHYRIVRLKNAIHSVYVQWTVPEVIYARIPSQLENPIPTTFAAGDYTHILLKLYSPITVDPDADPATTLFFDQDGQSGYLPQNGDKIRLILDDAANGINTAARTYEGDIIGLYVDGADQYAIVPAVFGTLEVKPGFLIEYFTPVTGEAEIYYEGGEDCYEIGDPGTEGRYHKGPIQDQVPGGDPATGKYTGGDTYWRRQRYTQTGIYQTEHQSPNRLITDRCEDIGRPFALSTDIQAEFYNSRVRVSGAFIPKSSINNLSSWSSLDYKDINGQWGTIMFLGFSNNTLLAICKFKVQPIYVSKGELLYLSGQTNVGRSDQIMEIADESVTDYGTHNPESVVIEGSYVYFWDKFQGAVCRYAQNGVVPITTKMINHFNAIGKERLALASGDLAIGGYDREHQMYFLSFSGEGDTIETISYDELKGGWGSYWSFNPGAYGRIGQMMISFDQSGGMWKHYESETRSNFYGEQYKPQITFVINEAPAQVKRFKSLRVMANRKFVCPTISVPFNYDYSSGQASKLLANHFGNYEGQWMADFLRDMNDTDAQFDSITPLATKQATAMLRGRELRGELMFVTLEAEDGSLSTVLTRADVYFIPSMVSHP
jgi:hypothetical protein|nr:MAG TPA: stabilization protein [Crassvirales sp.]